MIYFLCVRRNSDTIWHYLRAIWPHPMGARIKPLYYEDLADFKPGKGLYIFTDIELIEAVERERAEALHTRLVANPDQFQVWNNPRLSARRLEILNCLSRDGTNQFRAWRENETWPADIRYPVFVRDENEHKGSLTELLSDESAVRAALTKLRAGERPTQPLLVVEYLNYADANGVFRKYAIFKLGERKIRKHLLISSDWVVKMPDKKRFSGKEWLDEEARFLNGEPGHEQVEAIFKRFQIDYGRIDYALVDGRVQVFEINTNPMILRSYQLAPTEPRLAVHQVFFGQFVEALTPADPVGRIALFRRIWWRLHKPKFDPTPWWRRLFARAKPTPITA